MKRQAQFLSDLKLRRRYRLCRRLNLLPNRINNPAAYRFVKTYYNFPRQRTGD